MKATTFVHIFLYESPLKRDAGKGGGRGDIIPCPFLGAGGKSAFIELRVL